MAQEFVTTPPAKAGGFLSPYCFNSGFSVRGALWAPAYRPASPKAVPPPVAVGATWEVRGRAFQPQVRVAQTLNLLPDQGFLIGTGKAQLSTYTGANTRTHHSTKELLLQVLERFKPVLCGAQNECVSPTCAARAVHLPPKVGNPLAQS